MSRRELREHIFKMLFRTEFYDGSELSQQMNMFFEELEGEGADSIKEKDRAYIQTKFEDIVSHIEDIDKLINEVTKGWKTSRMGKVDLALIRLAVYEIKFEEDVPTGVAINEAVELAKSYGTDESASFVNGILAKLA